MADERIHMKRYTSQALIFLIRWVDPVPKIKWIFWRTELNEYKQIKLNEYKQIKLNEYKQIKLNKYRVIKLNKYRLIKLNGFKKYSINIKIKLNT